MVEGNPRGHIKRKLPTDLPPEGEHVKPALGREARKRRREARRERMETHTERLTEAPIAIKPMKPRSWSFRAGVRPRHAPAALKRAADRVRPYGVVWMSWRWVSGALSAMLLMILVGMLTSDIFYVSSVAVGGVNHLTREEVFRFSGVSQKHIFWVDAAAVTAALESNNNIADAEVRIGWPPQMVQIIIRERDPVLVWEQGTDRVWVDINGRVMYQRVDRPDLLRIVYDPNEPLPPDPIAPSTVIPTEVIHGGLLLKSQLPNIDVLLYHPLKGLGWRDPRGWMAWFGRGDNMAMKARVYNSLVTYNNDALQFGEIDVSDPDNPVYTVLWRKGQQ